MKLILPRSNPHKQIIVDDEDYESLNVKNWSINSVGYATRGTHKNINGVRTNFCYLMHRVLMCAKKGEIVDHINGNKLDNRKENLRKCTQKDNARNSKIRSNNTSGYKGVSYCKDRVNQKNQWQVTIKNDKGKSVYLGRYATKEEAAIIYNKEAKKLFGEFAKLNDV